MTDSSRALIRHFFDRFFEPNSVFSGGDPERRVIQFLGLLAMPGLFLPVFFHVSHPYTFVAYSMTVIGVVVAAKWESIFPDLPDYLVLSPLPVAPGSVFTAIAPLEFLYFGPSAILHLSFDLVATALLIEVVFFDFRKVPYTCAEFPGKVQLSLLAAAYLYGFTLAVRLVAFAKTRAVESPLSLGIALAAAGIAFLALAAVRRHGETRRAALKFAETDPSYTMLDLS